MHRLLPTLAAVLAAGLLVSCSDDSAGDRSAPSEPPSGSAPTSGLTPSGDASPNGSDDPTVPLPTTTVTGPDAAYCQAALEAGLAADIASLRSSIEVLSTSLPSRADEDVVEGLTLLRDLYADADDLAAAGQVYADADQADQAKMDVYFAFQAEVCD